LTDFGERVYAGVSLRRPGTVQELGSATHVFEAKVIVALAFVEAFLMAPIRMQVVH
jgi:hypothetical protein